MDLHDPRREPLILLFWRRQWPEPQKYRSTFQTPDSLITLGNRLSLVQPSGLGKVPPKKTLVITPSKRRMNVSPALGGAARRHGCALPSLVVFYRPPVFSIQLHELHSAVKAGCVVATVSLRSVLHAGKIRGLSKSNCFGYPWNSPNRSPRSICLSHVGCKVFPSFGCEPHRWRQHTT